MRSWRIGDVVVHRIDEAILPPPTAAWLLPDVTPEQAAELDPAFRHDDGSLRLATHTFAVESEGRRILVDTAVGNHKQRANPAWHDLDTDWLAGAEAAGFGPGAVDLVVMTHVHADHVGWNTIFVDGAWIPTFPGARHLTPAAEWAYWTSVDLEPARAQMIADSVLPVRDAGLLDTPDVPDDGLALTSAVRLVPTPGHTPGHVSVEIRSGGDTALISGDAVHHPVQLLHPEVGSCVDVDPGQARRTRDRLLTRARQRDALLLGTHFPEPTGVRLSNTGDLARRGGDGHPVPPA
ncbi:MBL fold metallo-hydrolase [Actinomycetospora sp. NBRC 106378]|uniref:MBL fold metallo-hydrolase n=1 Tax=Actinomycetospora sp. NBRC 106378 TaxID=3032208 RepID=UPI00249F9DB0|nr:MBL fold metallo-hydrolase [Actinomycetospora sp. NBRC 106378]GLZ50385.1 MBL fold metallo-hydrolase [Actinomycetospora sp. NBRC 106378]